jgi:hypothetical protein
VTSNADDGTAKDADIAAGDVATIVGCEDNHTLHRRQYFRRRGDGIATFATCRHGFKVLFEELPPLFEGGIEPRMT